MANFIKIKAADVSHADQTSDLLIGDIVSVMQGLANGNGDADKFTIYSASGKSYLLTATSKGKEVATTIQKATNQAKLNMITVRRGNGSWESGGGPGRSVPMKITGRAGSTRITLMPAPTGKGLVIGDTGRMILEMAGITDVWSSSKGQTRTQYNFARSTFNALKQANLARISRADVERLHISRGGMS